MERAGQIALREGAELIFQSHGPAAESLLQRLAICGFGPLKMILANRS